MNPATVVLAAGLLLILAGVGLVVRGAVWSNRVHRGTPHMIDDALGAWRFKIKSRDSGLMLAALGSVLLVAALVSS